MTFFYLYYAMFKYFQAVKMCILFSPLYLYLFLFFRLPTHSVMCTSSWVKCLPYRSFLQTTSWTHSTSCKRKLSVTNCSLWCSMSTTHGCTAPWPITSWSVFGRSIRTNNDTEGWHHHLNRKAKKGNLPFYVLLKLLAKQAVAVPLQVKLVTEGKLRRSQRKRTRETQGKLFALWKLYADNSLSVSRLLKKCGAIYGPTV